MVAFIFGFILAYAISASIAVFQLTDKIDSLESDLESKSRGRWSLEQELREEKAKVRYLKTNGSDANTDNWL